MKFQVGDYVKFNKSDTRGNLYGWVEKIDTDDNRPLKIRVDKQNSVATYTFNYDKLINEFTSDWARHPSPVHADDAHYYAAITEYTDANR